MNNKTISNKYAYEVKNDTVIISLSLDLTKWDGQEAVKELNKECYELHIGNDGISKLWPDVSVNIKLPIKTETTD